MNNYKIKRDDELCHWKYTKREKVNGKWRYWYDKAKDAVEDAAWEAEYALVYPAKRAKENFDWGYEYGNKPDSWGLVKNKSNADPKTIRKLADTTDGLARTYLDAHMFRPRSMDNDYRYADDAERLEKEADELREEARRAESAAGKLGQMTGRTVRRIQHQAEKGKTWLDDFLKRK